MKALMKKEFLLLNPVFYFGYLAVLLLLLPTYPATITFFLPLTISINSYVACISENNDMTFSSLIPISKKEYVKSKLFMTIFFEVTFMLLSLPILLLKQYLFSTDMMLAIPGLDSILSIFGCSFLSYGIYNLCLWPLYIKTAPKRYLATLLPIFVSFACFSFFGIVLAYLPSVGEALDFGGNILYQILYLLVGLLCFILLNLFTYQVSLDKMEKKDI